MPPDLNIMASLPSQNKKTPLTAVRAMIVSPDTFATTLYVLMLDKFGRDIYDWHPQTVRWQIERTFAIDLPKLSFDRIMAAMAIVSTDLFFKDVKRFIDIANVLSGDDFQPDEFDPADSMECAWAVTEALILDPPDEDNEVFCDDIRYYIGEVLKEEGYVTPPDILRIALGADFADKVRYNFADDPAMFGAIYQTQHGKTTEIEETLRDSLGELMEQLSMLPLDNGNTQELIQRLQQNIKGQL